ncbi:hypothetical protein RBI94_02220 [Pseudomonas putida]|uniref:hypothetical protein n=1 Tax=Pseudomonas putida TaxID=303 RepID=UPI0027BFE4A4|nr:hypothetical protein [Pseudomonas putida]MDQ2482837.1 hypothetical protein [Pseudomonas putida]
MTIQKRKATAAELKTYIATAEHAYQQAATYDGALRPARGVEYTAPTYYHILKLVVEKANEGYTLEDNAMMGVTPSAMSFSVVLRKPESMVEADLVIVRQQAEADYKAEIEKHNARVDRMEADQAQYVAQKAAWLAEQKAAREKAEDEAFREAMAQRGTRVADAHQLTSEWGS